MQYTLKAKIHERSIGSILDLMAEQLSGVERQLFVDLGIRKEKKLKTLKQEYQVRYGITARQFNSIAYDVRAQLKSQKELVRKWIRNTEKKKKAYQKKLEEAEEGKDQSRRKFLRHQYKRKIDLLDSKLNSYEKQLETPSVCFGSKKLFQKQFHLEENGFETFSEWKEIWKEERSSSFFLIGSKDESFGNQSCQLIGSTLKVRLTHSVAKQIGQTYIEIPIQFTYGQEVLLAAVASGCAMNYRFVRRKSKKPKDELGVWYVHLTVDFEGADRVTDRKFGALGIDLNPECIALSEIDPCGNLIHSWQVPVCLRGKRKEQIEAILAEETMKWVKYAAEKKIPIVIEKLDFEEKKQELRSRGLNRMLSQFAYSKFEKIIGSQCYRAGVELIQKNPAYTSVIGKAKFAVGYGLSAHQAAALAIARRGLGFGERLRTKAQVRTVLSERNRTRHVWADWRSFNQEAKKKQRESQKARPSSRKGRAASFSRQRPERPPGEGHSSRRPNDRSTRPLVH